MIPTVTLRYRNRATGAERALGAFLSVAHAKTYAESWATHHLAQLLEWEELEQQSGEKWLQTEEKHPSWIKRGRGLHQFVIQPVKAGPDGLRPWEETLNEEPGSFFG